MVFRFSCSLNSSFYYNNRIWSISRLINFRRIFLVTKLTTKFLLLIKKYSKALKSIIRNHGSENGLKTSYDDLFLCFNLATTSFFLSVLCAAWWYKWICLNFMHVYPQRAIQKYWLKSYVCKHHNLCMCVKLN